MIIRIASGRETFEHFGPLLHARDKLRDELFVVAVQRHMNDGGHCKSSLRAVDKHRIAGDHAKPPGASRLMPTCQRDRQVAYCSAVYPSAVVRAGADPGRPAFSTLQIWSIYPFFCQLRIILPQLPSTSDEIEKPRHPIRPIV